MAQAATAIPTSLALLLQGNRGLDVITGVTAEVPAETPGVALLGLRRGEGGAEPLAPAARSRSRGCSVYKPAPHPSLQRGGVGGIYRFAVHLRSRGKEGSGEQDRVCWVQCCLAQSGSSNVQVHVT